METQLRVAANDDGGTANLIYTWTVQAKPANAANPTFAAANGTNAGNSTTVTFHTAGTYTFQVTVKDGAGLSATSSVSVTVAQALMSIAVSGPASVPSNGTAQFTAVSKDQFGQPLSVQPAFYFNGSGGTISNQGLFAAAAAAGTYSITAYSAVNAPALTGSTSITVVAASNQPPTVVSQATATATSNAAVYNLSVLGSDPSGEANLIYTWASIGSPSYSAPVVFGANNGTNAGKNTTATFSAEGGWQYDVQLVVTISNPTTGLSVTKQVTFAVSPVLTLLAVTPGSATVSDSTSQQFMALGTDQFGNVFEPAASWSIISGGGTVASNGLYTAPASGTGSVTVKASFLNQTATATITLTSSTNNPPTVATAAHPLANPVTGTSVGLSVLGADVSGEASLAYTWSCSGPRSVTFSGTINGTNAAKNITATFTQAGTYNFLVTITDPAGLSVTSTTNGVTVNQTLTSISVTPGTATVADNLTQQFAATAYDQFGNALAGQPSFAWSSTGLGSVNGTGLYAAPASGTGSAGVTASSGGVSGMRRRQRHHGSAANRYQCCQPQC